MLTGRSQTGLSAAQIQRCLDCWRYLAGEQVCEFDIRLAGQHCTTTRYNEVQRRVILGADVYPGGGADARSRMSMLACLAHELAHARRHRRGFSRPTAAATGRDWLLDEAETSLDAAFEPVLSARDKADLVEDARDRLLDWLGAPQETADAS